MAGRLWLTAAPLLILSLVGCNKTEGSDPPNLFGASPDVSDVDITKERRHFQCQEATDLCACCCFKTVNQQTADIDLVTASAKVSDATGASDILVVILRFLDPPPPATQVNQVSLEMFDTGTDEVGQAKVGENEFVPVRSGDLVAGDGIYTRKFYFASTSTISAGACVEKTDAAGSLMGTFSRYTTSATIDPSSTLGFTFNVQAIDRSGNIDTSADAPLAIQGTFFEVQREPGVCGPPCP